MIIFIKITATILIAILFLFFYCRYLEYRSLYYPTHEIEFTPRNYGLDYEDLFINTEDNVQINAWLVEAAGPRAVIIFAHGNGGNISDRLEKMRFFHKLNITFCIFDYRGYGKSRGRPGESGFYADIRAVHRYVKARYPDLAVILYGESLGGAVAIDLAAESDNFPIDGLIVEGTFTSVKDMAGLIYPMLPAGFLKTRFDSLSKISKIKPPKLHLHSRADDIVPYSLGKRLFEQANEPKRFAALEGGHNDAFFTSEDLIRREISGFVDSICRR